MRFPARLEGGPFDGDQGVWRDVTTLPPWLYAIACPSPTCRAGGIHWTFDAAYGRAQGGELYEWDRNEDTPRWGSVAVYVWADLAAPDLLSERDFATA